MGAEKPEGPFAPGHQPPQARFQVFRLLVVKGRGGFHAHGRAIRYHPGTVHLRQSLPGRLPAGQIPVGLFIEAVPELPADLPCPVTQPLGLKVREQGVVMVLPVEAMHGVANYLIASMETKLKHWYQVITSEKPASSSLSRCSARVSGINTCSSAERFWLISRSE